MKIHGSRVLVTGGAGVIGSHTVDQLITKGASEIIVLDNFIRGTEENLKWATTHGNIQVVEGDIRDRELLKELFRGIDIVCHLAAIRITLCADQPREALEVLIDGTFNVLEAAVEAGIQKLVASSSASVYGTADVFPTKESHHLYNNCTLYGACKVANEQMMRAFYNMYGLDYLMLRYFNVYGPRMDIFGRYTEVIIRWLDCIDAGTQPVIFGSGEQCLDFTYVSDIARANILAMESGVTDELFNIGTGITTSLNELLCILLELTDSDLEPIYKPERKVGAINRRVASTEKSFNLLGFKSEVALCVGLQQLIAWRRRVLTLKGS